MAPTKTAGKSRVRGGVQDKNTAKGSRGGQRKTSGDVRGRGKLEARSAKQQLSKKLTDFESLVSIQEVKESFSRATVDARNEAMTEVVRFAPSGERPNSAQDIIAHCRSWVSAFDTISASWDAAMATPSKSAHELRWKEDYEALAGIVREGSHRGQALLTQFMAPGKEPERHVIEDAGVEALVTSVFSQTGEMSWGKLVEAQIRGLAEFAAMAGRNL